MVACIPQSDLLCPWCHVEELVDLSMAREPRPLQLSTYTCLQYVKIVRTRPSYPLSRAFIHLHVTPTRIFAVVRQSSILHSQYSYGWQPLQKHGSRHLKSLSSTPAYSLSLKQPFLFRKHLQSRQEHVAEDSPTCNNTRQN